MSRSASVGDIYARESMSRGAVSRQSIAGDSGLSAKRGSTASGSDEDEVHDLVLMFANSRIPRGSDAFQSILDDLLPLKEEHEHKLGLDGLDEVDSGVVCDDSSSSVNEQGSDGDNSEKSENSSEKSVKTKFQSPKPKNTSVLSVMQDKTQRRTPSPKSHVHWPNAERDIASSPTTEKRHHARLYMKTVPAKPILKHDEDVKDQINVKT